MSRDWIEKVEASESLGTGDKITIGVQDYILGEPLLFRGISTKMVQLDEKKRSITLYTEGFGKFQMCNIGKDINEFWGFINESCRIS